MNLAKKKVWYVGTYSEQLWFHKIFSKYDSLGGDRFSVRVCQNAQNLKIIKNENGASYLCPRPF
jgi:hypothetical protein